MSTLKTYSNRQFEMPASVDRVADGPLPTLAPGMQVEWPGRGGTGMVVAVTEAEVAVLWSVEPRASIPNVDVKVESQPIEARARKLKTTWSFDGKVVDFDLKE